MEALRSEIAHLKELLDITRNERDNYKTLLDREQNERAEDLRRHHRERLALINDIGGKVDGLLTSHDQAKNDIITRLDILDGNLTTPPSPPKTHGFAVTSKWLAGDLRELRFIAGQSKYVEQRLGEVEEEVIVPFTTDGNPIE